MPVEISVASALAPEFLARWESIGQAILGAIGFEEAIISVALVDAAEIRSLNAHWRQKDAVTDVLSFPTTVDPESSASLTADGGVLGDIALCLERIRAQTEEFNDSGPRLERPTWIFDQELLFLLIHGCLHLLGHDHEAEVERAEMEAEERRLFLQLEGLLS